MADRTYYGLLEFLKDHLKRVEQKPTGQPGTGIIQADLTTCEKRARVWVYQRLVREVGMDLAATLDAAWVLEAATYPDVVPTDIRELAKLVGSSFVWGMVEKYHGVQRQQDDRKKATRVLTSVKLMEEAEARWRDIQAAGVLVKDDMTVVDLTAEGGDVIGVASPAGDATFFPAKDDTDHHGVRPSFSAEGTLKDLEGFQEDTWP